MDIEQIKFLLESAILDKRFRIASAERDLKQFDIWSCNYNGWINDADREIKRLCDELVEEKKRLGIT